MLDTPRVVPTPEGIELTIKVAGPVTRARAWLIDLLIRAVIYLLLAVGLSMLGRTGMGIFLVALFLLEWLYPILFEVYWNGATPGKRACNLRALHDNGTPIGWRASFTRNTLRAVDFLPSFYGFGLIAMLLNRDFKRLGDLAAGTVVVYVDAEPRTANTNKGKVASPSSTPVEALASIPSLTLPEQRAIIDFASRQKRWSDDRQVELAMHAGTALDGATGRDAVDHLRALADHFTGRSAVNAVDKSQKAERANVRTN
jgi:uncharacterized RDD family membrane protein YckC